MRYIRGRKSSERFRIAREYKPNRPLSEVVHRIPVLASAILRSYAAFHTARQKIFALLGVYVLDYSIKAGFTARENLIKIKFTLATSVYVIDNFFLSYNYGHVVNILFR